MTSLSGIISLVIIVITIFFSYRGFKDRDFFDRYKFSVDKLLLNREYYRIITSSFLHVNWFHLGFNMFSLFIFSGVVETYLGPLRFILLYFGSMAGGDLLALWIRRNDGGYTSVGASGAVCGLIFGAIALVPGMSIGLFPLPLNIPGWLYGILFIAYCIYGIRSRGGGVGHEAHLGGGMAGMCIALIMEPAAFRENYFAIIAIAIPCIFFLVMTVRYPHFLLVDNFFIKKKDKDFYSIDQKYNAKQTDNRKEMDRILEKIHKRGINSLTAVEKQFMKEYSDKL